MRTICTGTIFVYNKNAQLRLDSEAARHAWSRTGRDTACVTQQMWHTTDSCTHACGLPHTMRSRRRAPSSAGSFLSILSFLSFLSPLSAFSFLSPLASFAAHTPAPHAVASSAVH